MRLQLQGSYNNPAFFSGYNYKSALHAIRTVLRVNQCGLPQIVQTESPSALYSGYRATMVRDLPFSALQFAFYEQFKRWSTSLTRQLTGQTKSMSDNTPWEVLNGAAAGGLAGFLTTPLGWSINGYFILPVDVVKTRIQTATRRSPKETAHRIISSMPLAAGFSAPPKNLQTESVITALRYVYVHEGWQGLFRGMGPRSGWCASQSGVMFLGYEFFLRLLAKWESKNKDIGM